MLKDKNIVIGVSGGIAAYKASDIVSRLRKLNANLNVIMTKSAIEFVTPLTFQTLSQNYVVTDMFQEPKTWDVEHISLAQKADIFLIVPATANIIGKIANGIADDMLSTTVMATKAPVVIAPAMNTNMFENIIVQNNIERLRNYGYIFIEPEKGRLACGDYGKGKLASPEVIVEKVISIIQNQNKKDDFKGKKILVTAGPTQEPIDPVRFITNHSSGKMGYAIAKHAYDRGAEVILISGPTNLPKPYGVKVVDVTTSMEMYNEVLRYFKESDIIIKAAAVSDYKPKLTYNKKIKKSNSDLYIELSRNPDILKELGKIKEDKILVGFAAETDDLIKNAMIKVKNKNLDFIVANDLTQPDAGFKSDTNIIKLIDKLGNIQSFDKKSKDQVAEIILDKILLLINEG